MKLSRRLGTITAGIGLASLALAGCTKQNTFRLAQQLEQFDISQQVNTRVDLLWVVDNSASMDVSQERLRKGFSRFVGKYMRPNWDIRMAVITTDTFMANPAFMNYLSKPISGSVGWSSSYVKSRLATWENPDFNPQLLNLSTGAFDQGITRRDQLPAQGPNYARLLPGVHDGPIAGLCTEMHPYFFKGVTNCRVRDDQFANSGPENCLRPASGETSLTQCVNTVQNDTIHSGKPIISTIPPAGVRGDDNWIAQLTDQFMINTSVGASGMGSERGLGSLLQLIQDNESTETAFFRPGSQRVIVFVGDEDDQTMQIPNPLPVGFDPYTGYKSTCPVKTVDGYSYKLTSCPDPTKLLPVQSVKEQLDAFFKKLDGRPESVSSYMIVSIVALTGEAVQAMQKARAADDNIAGNSGSVAVDRADRFLELGQLVGNGSFALNMADEDYSSLLDHLGTAIVERRGSFTLSRAPTGEEDMVVTIVHADGTQTQLRPDQFQVVDSTLTVTDEQLMLGLSATDKILINYQPKTVL